MIKYTTWIVLVFILVLPLKAEQIQKADESKPTRRLDAYRDNACIFCHENLPGRLSEIVQEWTQSIHFENKVTCDGCHGGDAHITREQFDNDEAFKNRAHLQRDSNFLILTRSQGTFTGSARGRSLSYFCGKCHANIKEKHLGSPHGDLGSPTCLYCHGQGTHAIQKTNIDIIDTRSRTDGGRCATCHQAATMETVSNIKTILINAEEHLENATQQYTWLKKHQYKNLAMENMFSHSKETLSQLRQTFHSFNMREINNFSSAINDNAELTDQAYNMIFSLTQTKNQQAMIGAFSVLFLLSFAALLLLYRKLFLHSLHWQDSNLH